jgi:thioredoxin-like negative regulator of GroEL
LEKRTDVKLIRLNADDNKEKAISHKLSKLPSCYLYKEGVLIKNYEGTVPNLDTLLEDIS